MALFPAPIEISIPPLNDGVPSAGERRARARTALSLADALLDRLELLSMKDLREVPESLSGVVNALRRAAVIAGIHRPNLEAHCGVFRLMDDVYDLEDELLPRCRRRVFPSVPAGH